MSCQGSGRHREDEKQGRNEVEREGGKGRKRKKARQGREERENTLEKKKQRGGGQRK